MSLFASGERWALHQGESLHVLPGFEPGSFDAVITDPPYSSGGIHAGSRTASTTSKYVQAGCEAYGAARGHVEFPGDQRDQRSWTYWCTLWLSRCLRLTRPGGYCLCFIDWRQLPAMTDALQAAGWIWRGVAPWNKGLGARAPHPGYFRHQCEYIVWGTHGPFDRERFAAGPHPGCFSFPVLRHDKLHQTGKPTELMRQLVRVVPAEARILDPFAGSGTTLAAAVVENRRAVGVEVLGHYCRVAAERLRSLEGQEMGQETQRVAASG